MINQRFTLLATAALWVLLATIWLPGVRTEPCHNLEIFDSNGLPQHVPDICLNQYRTPDCRKFVDTFNENDLPAPFQRKKPPIQRPDSLNISSLEFAYNRILYPGLQVCWSSPEGATSKASLFGFLLIWYPANSIQRYCQLFLLNESNPELRYDRLKFKFEIPKVEDNATLTVQLYSMPPPRLEDKDKEYSVQKAIYHSPAAKYIIQYGTEPAKWSPSILFRTYTNGTIDIIFSHPPIYLELSLYQIVMVKESDPEKPIYDKEYKIPPSTGRAPQGIVRLQVPSSGWYAVTILVKENPSVEMIPGFCACWTLDLDDERHCESICGSSQARINISVGIGADTAALPRTTFATKSRVEQSQENSAMWETAFIIISSVLGILLIASMVILMALIVLKSLK